MKGSLRPSAVATALAVTLVVLFVLCAIAEVILPAAPLSHAWIGLFTTSAVGSARAWFEGVVASIVLGAVGGYIVAVTYNALGSRMVVDR
jgi:hypothetical protein